MVEEQIIKLFGLFFLLSAIVLWILPLLHFKKYGQVDPGKPYFESSKLVDRGIYRYVRHPQYLAYMLLNIGFCCIKQSPFLLPPATLAVMFFYIHCLQEEEELTILFPRTYPEYCLKTPRLNILSGLFKKRI